FTLHTRRWQIPQWTTLQGPETPKARPRLLRFCRGNGVDLGAGGCKICPEALAIDLPKPTAGRGTDFNFRGDATDLYWFRDSVLDYVYSSHCLEDVPDLLAALSEWWRVLRVGGYLVLYLPHGDLYPHFGTPLANPHHVRDLWPADIHV